MKSKLSDEENQLSANTYLNFRCYFSTALIIIERIISFLLTAL
jgi:hypothetical protein